MNGQGISRREDVLLTTRYLPFAAVASQRKVGCVYAPRDPLHIPYSWSNMARSIRILNRDGFFAGVLDRTLGGEKSVENGWPRNIPSQYL